MSLRDQLKKLLPSILPTDPNQSVKGTQLIDLVRGKLEHEYSDATLRYHFSIMSCDPSSPIVKVDSGQGYYLRKSTLDSMSNVRHLLPPIVDQYGDGVDINRCLLRASKFRSLMQQYYSEANSFPFFLDATFSEGATYGDLWHFPDAVIIDWEVGILGTQFDTGMVRLKKSFGSQPFTVRSVKLKLSVNRDTYREDFFQALSNSRWAHFTEFVVAETIEDDSVRRGLALLGAEFGIGVICLGLDSSTIDDLPEPEVVARHTRLGKDSQPWSNIFRLSQISAARPRAEVDWAAVRGMQAVNPEFESLFQWVTCCLESNVVMTFQDYADRKKRGELPAPQKPDAFAHASSLVDGD